MVLDKKAWLLLPQHAGRGTDIKLTEETKELGALYFRTERHESRRIDNQLRGRSGRQGDNGASKFFLSLEDDLMRILDQIEFKRSWILLEWKKMSQSSTK